MLIFSYKECEKSVLRGVVGQLHLNDSHTGNWIAKGELEVTCRACVSDIWMHTRVAESDIISLKTVLVFSTKCGMEFYSVGIEWCQKNFDS